MSYSSRLQLYEKIKAKRGNPLICYVTSIRPNMSGQMAGDAIPPLIDQLELIPKEYTDKIDFIIISNGGDPITSLRIMSLLRERFKKVNVLLPYVAYSAATILALGADEIIMHPYSNLGPVDPQITVSHKREDGSSENIQFSSEDLMNFIDFVRTDVGVTDQLFLMDAINPFIKDVGATAIGSTKRSQRLTLSLSEKMLSWHIADINRVKSISKALNSSYYHHGYAVGTKEAVEIGLPIVKPDSELEGLLWNLWLDVSAEMKCNEPFDVVKEIMSDPNSASSLRQISVINMPANLPTEMQRNVFSQIASNVNVVPQSSLNISPLIATIESSEIAKSIYNDLSILYWRNPDISLGFNVITSQSGWIDYRGNT